MVQQIALNWASLSPRRNLFYLCHLGRIFTKRWLQIWRPNFGTVSSMIRDRTISSIEDVQIPYKCIFIHVWLKVHNSWLPLWIFPKRISKEKVNAVVLTVHNLIVLVPFLYIWRKGEHTEDVAGNRESNRVIEDRVLILICLGRSTRNEFLSNLRFRNLFL